MKKESTLPSELLGREPIRFIFYHQQKRKRNQASRERNKQKENLPPPQPEPRKVQEVNKDQEGTFGVRFSRQKAIQSTPQKCSKTAPSTTKTPTLAAEVRRNSKFFPEIRLPSVTKSLYESILELF